MKHIRKLNRIFFILEIVFLCITLVIIAGGVIGVKHPLLYIIMCGASSTLLCVSTLLEKHFKNRLLLNKVFYKGDKNV